MKHFLSTKNRSPLSLLALPLLLLPVACGGGGGGGGGGEDKPGGSVDELEESLGDLGVDTSPTARQDDEGEDLPGDYAPFGSSWEISKTSELLVVGMGSIDYEVDENPVSVIELTGENGEEVYEKLLDLPAEEATWAMANQDSAHAFPASLRAALAADTDGDGLEESLVVYQEELETRLAWMDDATGTFARSDMQISLQTDVTNLSATALDFDGDGDDDLVLGLTQSGLGVLLFVRSEAGAFEVLPLRLEYMPSLIDPVLHMQLATGNLDHDASEETVVVLNEYSGSPSNPGGASRYAIYDDEASGFASLAEGPMIAHDQDNQARIVLIGSAAVGDIDGDNIDEVVLGGVTEFVYECNSSPRLLFALDDADHGLEPLGGLFAYDQLSSCDSQSRRKRSIQLNTLDIDGDGLDEVQVDRYVFDDFGEGIWFEREDWKMDQGAFWSDSSSSNLYDFNTVCCVVGDFNGDDREDVAVTRGDMYHIQIFGVDQIEGMQLHRSIDARTGSSYYPKNVQIVPVNVDTDSPVMKYDDGTYELVFSEPVVLAAMAAPPCIEGIDQNHDACQTTFGNTESFTQASERTVSFSASSSVGVNIDGGFLTQSEFELKATATVQANRVTSQAYTLSKTILFTSGSGEDTVVFTTVPLDQFTYTVLSHPDPELIGREIVVSLPREPIILQVERDFYNAHVQDGSILIDESVFQHSIGDIGTYPGRPQKNALLGQLGGLEVGPVGVGQGGGSTELTLEVSEELGSGGSLEIGYEVSIEVTGGTVLGGVTVGSSSESAWSVTSGESTTYTGSVGAIGGDDFADNLYQFGLFTYVYTHPTTGRQFEVVNYWVE